MDFGAYRSFVEPDHELVAALVPSVVARGNALQAVTATLRQHFEYDATGSSSTISQLAAGSDGARVRANCFAMSSLLVSCLRAAGLSSDEAFVALGTRRVYPGYVTSFDFHAWTLVHLDGAFWWIAPESLTPESTSGGSVLDRYNLHVLFNDRRAYCFEPEKRRLLLAAPSRSMRVYAYGVIDQKLRQAVRKPAIRQLIGSLFSDRCATDGDGTDAVHEAIELGILAPDGRSFRPGPRLIVVPADAARDLRNLLEVPLEAYLKIAAATVPRLKTEYDRCSAAATFPWSQAQHAVVAGLFLDLGTGAQLRLPDDVNRRHGANAVCAFEHLETVNAYGVQWVAAHGSAGLGQLWHRDVEREDLCATPAMVTEMIRLSEKTIDRLGSRERLLLQYAKLARKVGDRYHVSVPVFGPRDSDRILSVLALGARRLAVEAILPALRRANHHHFWRGLGARISLRLVVARLMLEFGIDRVVDARLVDPFPSGRDIPVGWGRWLWIESGADPRSLVPQTGMRATRHAVAV